MNYHKVINSVRDLEFIPINFASFSESRVKYTYLKVYINCENNL